MPTAKKWAKILAIWAEAEERAKTMDPTVREQLVKNLVGEMKENFPTVSWSLEDITFHINTWGDNQASLKFPKWLMMQATTNDKIEYKTWWFYSKETCYTGDSKKKWE